MPNKEPTPIPLRASRKKAPEPITFPTTPRLTPFAVPVDEKIREYIAHLVREQLREHDMRLVRTLHKVVMDWPIAEIMVMGEAQFEALCRSVLEDEE